jgi:hypothetical protein
VSYGPRNTISWFLHMCVVFDPTTKLFNDMWDYELWVESVTVSALVHS